MLTSLWMTIHVCVCVCVFVCVRVCIFILIYNEVKVWIIGRVGLYGQVKVFYSLQTCQQQKYVMNSEKTFMLKNNRPPNEILFILYIQNCVYSPSVIIGACKVKPDNTPIFHSVSVWSFCCESVIRWIVTLHGIKYLDNWIYPGSDEG